MIDTKLLPNPEDRTSAWDGDEPAYVSWTTALMGWDTGTDRVQIWEAHRLGDHYGENSITRQALERVADVGALHEYGAGNGYVSRLLTDLGADVVASDPTAGSARTSRGAALPAWTSVTVGRYGDFDDERIPLLVWPYTNEPIRWLTSPSGPARFVLINDERTPSRSSGVASRLGDSFVCVDAWEAGRGWRIASDRVSVWQRR